MDNGPCVTSPVAVAHDSLQTSLASSFLDVVAGNSGRPGRPNWLTRIPYPDQQADTNRVTAHRGLCAGMT
jgi:hypothetical protein